MNRDKLGVWIDADFMPEKTLVGTLAHDRGSIRFNYAPSWLDSPYKFDIDVNPNIDKADHVLNLDAGGNRPSLDTVLETAAFYALSKAEANRIVNEVLGVVRTWKTVERQKFKLAAADMALMESAFVI